jgi:molybdopterin-guanine dinucleotide biosynthesis protein A
VQTEFLVVVSCDMPGLPADLVDRLTAPLWSKQESSPEISYAHDGIRAQYLCAAIRGKCLNSLTPYLDAGHRTVRDWFASRRSIRVDFADTPSSFTNFNTLA